MMRVLDYVIIAAVLAALFFAVRSAIKSGGSNSSCSSCPNRASCRRNRK